MLEWLAMTAAGMGGATVVAAVIMGMAWFAVPRKTIEKPAEAVSVLDWKDYTPELDWDLVGQLELDLYGKRFYHSRDHEKPKLEPLPAHPMVTAMKASGIYPAQAAAFYDSSNSRYLPPYSGSPGISREEYGHIIRHKESHGNPRKAHRR